MIVERCTGVGCAARDSCRRAEPLTGRVRNPGVAMSPPGKDRRCPSYVPVDGLLVGRLANYEHQAVIVGERPTKTWDGDPRTLLTGFAFRRLSQWLFLVDTWTSTFSTYLRTFERVNVIQQPMQTPTKLVKAAAGLAIRCLAGSRPVVVCGRTAAQVLGFTTGAVPRREGQFALIPHPSNLCREWGDPEIRKKAVQVVRDVLGLPQ